MLFMSKSRVTSPETELTVLAERFGRPEWRVEYSQAGACYVTIFDGLDSERRARDYHAALKIGALKPIHPDR